MMPSKLYTIYSTTTSKHLGYSSQYKSSIFAFVKEDHAIQARQYLKYDAHKIESVNPDTYIIRNKSIKQERKPIDKRTTLVQRFDPQTLAVFLFVNNVDLKLIDRVNLMGSSPSQDLLLESNYKLIIDGDIDNDLMVEVLNNLYKNSKEVQ